MNQAIGPNGLEPGKKPGVRLLPLYVISVAFLSLTCLPTYYPSAGWWASLLAAVLTVSACVLVFAPGLALLELAGGRVPASLAPGVVIIGSGASGWLLFWAWFAGRSWGVCASLAVSVAAIGILCSKQERSAWGKVCAPAIVSILVCIGYVSLAGDRGGLQYGDQVIAGRYWAVMDNMVPRMFADRLIQDRELLKAPLLGDWHSSDRPPLQTGMLLIAYPFVSKPGLFLGCLLLGIAINVFWIWGLWSFLRVLDLDERKILQVMLLLVLVGAVFINTIYTWPKMLSAALALTVGAAMLVRNCAKPVRLWVIGFGCALSMLSHGAAIFALLGLVTIFWMRRKEWTVADVFIVLALSLMIYYPWMAYQTYFDPPGDRLIKWHLAGVVPRDETRSAGEMLATEYKKAGFSGVAQNKWLNIRMLLGDTTGWNGEGAQGFAHPGWNDKLIGQIRHFFILRLGPSPTLLLVGIALLLTPTIRRAAWLKPLLGTLLATVSIFALLEFGSNTSSATWLWHAPYTALLLWCLLGALAIVELGTKWFSVFLVVHLGLFVGLWAYNLSMWSAVPQPADPGRPDFVARLVAAVAFLMLGRLFYTKQAVSENVRPPDTIT